MAQDGGIVIQPSAEIDKRFQLSVFNNKVAHKNTLLGLLQNGLYYMTVGNSISALASFSSAASYVYALKTDTNDTKYDPVLNSLLGYVEKLQTEAKRGGGGGGGGGGAGGKAKEEESNNEWDVECETFGCEEDASKNCLTFKEVVGLKKEKETFFAAIAYPLIYPNLYTKAAKGLLLYGPPGTGKTFIIKAAVRELSMKFPDVKVLFFPLTGADLKGKYVGETEKKIVRAYTCAARRACQMTDVYNDVHPKQCLEKIHKEFEAKRAASANSKEVFKKHPQYVSVVFIDEFDAVGGDRSKDESGMTANAVNTMLQMMDGLQSFGNVITVCATNFPWNLDSALLRRFNEQIYLNVPTMEDIKTLVTLEQKNRLKYFDANKQKYCAGTSMDKFFKTSPEMQDYTGVKPQSAAEKAAKEAAAATKDPCIKDSNKEGSIVDMIDKSYLNDKSPALIAAVSEMAEKHYSNSDVSSVMQKAFNIVSETALRSTVWQKVNYTNTAKKPPVEETYWVSRLTKLKGASQDLLNTSLKAIENSANIDSKYAGNFFSFPENKMDLPANIYMDSSSTKSIFGEEVPADKTELKITSLKVYRENWNGIEKDSTGKWVSTGTGKEAKWKPSGKINGLQIYTNMNFIANLPTILMFNDPSISQVFFNNEQVVLLQQEIETRKNNKQTSKSILTIDVIFTRVLDIEYPGSAPTSGDGINHLIKSAGLLLNEIVDLEEKDWESNKGKITNIEKDAKTLIKSFMQYIKVPEESSQDYIKNKERWVQLNRVLAANDKIGENPLFKKISDKVGYNDNKYTLPSGKTSSESASYGTLAFLEYVNLNEIMKKVMAKLYWNAKFAVDTIDGEKTDIKKLSSDIFQYNQKFIKFMEDSELVQLEAVVKSNAQDLNVLSLQAREVMKDGIKRLNSEAETIFTGEPFKTQKLFFFDATINPLSADWVKYKASGPSVFGTDGLIGSLGSYFSSMKKKLSSFFSGKDDVLDNLETTVASRIAESGISMSKYLLTRTVNIGVLEVSDEKNILIVDRKAPGLDALETVKTWWKEAKDVEGGAENASSDPGSVASSPRSQKGGYKKQTKKLKRGGSAKTRKNTGASKEYEYKYIHWFNIVKGANSMKFDKIHYNQSFFTLESITSSLLVGGGGGAAVGAAAGAVGASYFGLASAFSLAGISIAATPILIGAGVGFALLSLGGGAAGTDTEAATNNVISASERLLFNQMLGYWYSFKSPEDNIYIVNLMVAEIFGGESLEIKNPILSGSQSDWSLRLPATFTENYMMALKARERILTQVTEYAYLKPVDIIDGLEGNKSTINIKKMGDSQVDEKSLNKSNFLSFYMDASFITAAMKSYPSTYNPVTGGQLNDYNKNRTKFLEDYAAGKYDKKK